MVVMKFGGTSVRNAQAYTRVMEIVKSRLDRNPVVVLSATSGTTDSLLECCKYAAEGDTNSAYKTVNQIEEKHLALAKELINNDEILKKVTHGINEYIEQLKDLVKGVLLLTELSARSKAKIISIGEFISTEIFSGFLTETGMDNRLTNARDFIITSDDPLKGEPVKEQIRKKVKEYLNPVIEAGEVPVVQGFVSSSADGKATTLGRGGSDYTASLIGMALNAEEIEIWTDVDGILTADPRKVKGTKIVKEVSFKEAAELAFFGAKVLHPSTIIPAIDADIPVRILNSNNPGNPGTLIKYKIEDTTHSIKSITSKEDIKVLNIYSPRMLLAHGFLKKIFEIFDKYSTSVDLITTSEVNVSLTLDNEENLEDIMQELANFSEVRVESDKSLVCVVGKDLKYTKGIAKKIFQVLGDYNITMISQGASVINFSFVVDRSELTKVLQTLHDQFFN